MHPETDCIDQSTYCRLCSAAGAGVCAPKCDGGACAPKLPQTCTQDRDCPVLCVHGYCATAGGVCASST